MEKDVFCPQCEKKVLKILYGLPAPSFMENPPKDVILGGCVIDDNSPSYYCPHCHKYFMKDIEKENE